MRLDGSTPDERRDYAAFIEQVTTTGQTPGTAIGQLPPGYAPLTEELRAKAAEAVKKIRAYTDPTEAPPVDAPDGDTPTPPGDGASPRPPARGPEGSNNIPVNPDDLGTSLISGGPNVTPGGTPDEAGLTETNAPSGFAGLFSALGGLLLLGASGAVAVPGLLRRRDTPLL